MPVGSFRFRNSDWVPPLLLPATRNLATTRESCTNATVVEPPAQIEEKYNDSHDIEPDPFLTTVDTYVEDSDQLDWFIPGDDDFQTDRPLIADSYVEYMSFERPDNRSHGMRRTLIIGVPNKPFYVS